MEISQLLPILCLIGDWLLQLFASSDMTCNRPHVLSILILKSVMVWTESILLFVCWITQSIKDDPGVVLSHFTIQ